MKRLKAFITLIGIFSAFVLSIGTLSIKSSAGVLPPPAEFLSFRIHSSKKLSDESVRINFTFHYHFYNNGSSQIAVKNENNVLILGEYTPTIVLGYYGISTFEINKHNIRDSHKYRNVFATSKKFVYDIPMDFFAGDSGTIEFFVSMSNNGQFIPVNDANANLISYTKSDGRIHFAIVEKAGGDV